jgi:septum formation protein
VIGSDTVVVLDGKILEKPTSKENAFEMLKSLSGKSHYVCTGVALISSDFQINFSHSTTVEFDELSEETIQAYIDTKEPMDKAGSYGIQAIGGSFVKRIDGCFYNVMGFPLHSFCTHLREVYGK